MDTTAMLSFIQDLRRKKSVVFIVATNFIKRLDRAITREGGRFDLRLLVDSPTCAEKKRMFRDKLEENEKLRVHALPFCAALDTFVEKHYADAIRYFTFSEWSSFVKEIIRAADKSATMPLDVEMKTILDRHTGGIALDESLRDTYQDIERFVRVP